MLQYREGLIKFLQLIVPGSFVFDVKVCYFYSVVVIVDIVYYFYVVTGKNSFCRFE